MLAQFPKDLSRLGSSLAIAFCKLDLGGPVKFITCVMAMLFYLFSESCSPGFSCVTQAAGHFTRSATAPAQDSHKQDRFAGGRCEGGLRRRGKLCALTPLVV